MLANSLTLDDEDAVQAELAQLRDEVVRLECWGIRIVTYLTPYQMLEDHQKNKVELPTPPTNVPVLQQPEGTALAAVTA